MAAPAPTRRNGLSPAQPHEKNPRGEGGRLRRELIETASSVIAQTGDADSLTLRDLARRLGISAPSIYRHFSDIEQLKLAVVDNAFAEFSAQRNQARRSVDDPEAGLLVGCRAYCQFAERHPGVYRFMFSYRSPAKGRESRAGAAAFAALEASIRRCQEERACRLETDARVLAADVWAALHGAILLRLNAPDFEWSDSLESMTKRMVIGLVGLREPRPAGRTVGQQRTTQKKRSS